MKKLLKWVGIGILALIVISVISSMGKTSQDKTGDTAIPSQTVQEPTVVKAQELADDFDANQVAAENKWKGKLVQFSAEVTNITDTGLSFSKVASKQFSMAQIRCRITDKEQLLPLKNGQIVTVKGVVGGQMIGVIDVSDCSVVK